MRQNSKVPNDLQLINTFAIDQRCRVNYTNCAHTNPHTRLIILGKNVWEKPVCFSSPIGRDYKHRVWPRRMILIVIAYHMHNCITRKWVDRYAVDTMNMMVSLGSSRHSAYVLKLSVFPISLFPLSTSFSNLINSPRFHKLHQFSMFPLQNIMYRCIEQAEQCHLSTPHSCTRCRWIKVLSWMHQCRPAHLLFQQPKSWTI